MSTFRDVMVLRSIKGAPATVLLAMVLVGPVSVGPAELAEVTGYSRQTVSSALSALGALGLVRQHARYGGWMLTVDARQFILGEYDPTLEVSGDGADSNSEVKSFNLPTCSSSTCSLGITLDEDTSTTSSEVKKFNLPLDEEGEAAVEMLVDAGRWERTRNGRGARDSVEIAVEAGWSGAECLVCVEGWLRFARCGGKSADWVKDPAGWAAYALRERKRPPQVDDPEDTQRYVKGKYAHFIQH